MNDLGLGFDITAAYVLLLIETILVENSIDFIMSNIMDDDVDILDRLPAISYYGFVLKILYHYCDSSICIVSHILPLIYRFYPIITTTLLYDLLST